MFMLRMKWNKSEEVTNEHILNHLHIQGLTRPIPKIIHTFVIISGTTDDNSKRQ
jgi:hypothetical protein